MLGLCAGACTLGARDDADLSGKYGQDAGAGGSAGTGGSGACTKDTADCDKLAENGCESPLTKDPKNCGACGNECQSDGGLTAVCVDGKCGLSTCTAPMADCDGDGSCETDTSSSITHCGFCEYACALPHAKSACAKGCQIDECDSGFESCDGIASNGCETPLDTEQNCGACGAGCSLANATASCSTGTCQISQCNGGYGDCDKLPDTGCESNTQTDPSNCGACGTACATGQVCQAGKCVVSGCTPPMADCDGNASSCETNTDTSLAHCGFCNNPCALAHATAACSAGKCVVGACAAGWGDCDASAATGCETQLNTVTNCKSCGDTCAGGPNVVSANCGAQGCNLSCKAGYANCNGAASDGCEAQLSADPAHCGSCSKDCSVGAPSGAQPGCANGQCTYNCSAGTADCDSNGSCETNLATSAQNCGECGKNCGQGACQNGACAPEVVVSGSDLTSVDFDYPSSANSLVFGRSAAGVFRVNKSTKVVTNITTQQGSNWLDVLGPSTFFGNSQGVYRVPTNGGTPTKINGTLGIVQLDAWGGDVWFSSSGSPSVLGTTQTGGPTDLFENQQGALGVVHEVGNIYWTMPSQGVIRFSDDNGGAKQTLATGQGEPSYIVTDGQNIYWTATTDGAIRRSNPNGGQLTTVATGLTAPYALAVDSGNLFFASKGAGALWRVPTTGGTPVKLAEGLTGVVCIMASYDGTHVYWVDSTGLKRVPK